MARKRSILRRSIQLAFWVNAQAQLGSPQEARSSKMRTKIELELGKQEKRGVIADYWFCCGAYWLFLALARVAPGLPRLRTDHSVRLVGTRRASSAQIRTSEFQSRLWEVGERLSQLLRL